MVIPTSPVYLNLTNRTLCNVHLAEKRAPTEADAPPVKTKRKQPFVLESFLSHADGGRTKAKYRNNETIFRQGDSADAVFYIMGAKCKVTVVSEKGKEAVVALHEKGDFFGEGCLTGQPRRLATGPGRSVVQFEREAPGEVASINGKFWQGGKAGARNSEGQPGDSRRDDRHHEVAGEFLHEQI